MQYYLSLPENRIHFLIFYYKNTEIIREIVMNISPQEFVSAAAAIIREATYDDIVLLAVHY